MAIDGSEFEALIHAYKEQTEINQQLLSAVKHQTDVLSRCISEEFHRLALTNVNEHNEIKSRVNIGIVQMVTIFGSTILNMILHK